MVILFHSKLFGEIKPAKPCNWVIQLIKYVGLNSDIIIIYNSHFLLILPIWTPTAIKWWLSNDKLNFLVKYNILKLQKVIDSNKEVYLLWKFFFYFW